MINVLSTVKKDNIFSQKTSNLIIYPIPGTLYQVTSILGGETQNSCKVFILDFYSPLAAWIVTELLLCLRPVFCLLYSVPVLPCTVSPVIGEKLLNIYHLTNCPPLKFFKCILKTKSLHNRPHDHMLIFTKF